jgi:hypothetical protein
LRFIYICATLSLLSTHYHARQSQSPYPAGHHDRTGRLFRLARTRKSGLDRNRLAYLRTKPNAVLSLKEAKALAPIFKMTIDQLADELERIEEEEGQA